MTGGGGGEAGPGSSPGGPSLPGPDRGRPGRPLLGRLADAISRHPVAFVAAALLLTVLSIIVTWRHLTLKTGRNDLLSPDLPYNRRYLDFMEEFSSMEGGVIVVEAEEAAAAIAYAEELAADLRGRLPDPMRVTFKIEDLRFLRKGALLLPAGDLERIAAGIEGGAGPLRASLSGRGLEGLFDGIAGRISGARREEDFPREALPILLRLVGSLSFALTAEGEVGPLLGGLPGGDRRYFWSDDRRFLFLLIDPYPEEDEELTRIVRESMSRVGPRNGGVRAGLTGRPVLAQDEMATVSVDIVLATIASFVGVSILFIIFFRGVLQPLLATFTLLVGIAWAFGAATVLVGHLNLLSVVFGVILIGLGIDFGIHILARYREERGRGTSPPSALREAMEQTGGGIVTGALTIASAFFSTAIGTFSGIADMGVITGAGVLLCLVAMLTLFPALLILTDRRPPRPTRWQVRAPGILIALYRHPLPLLAIGIAITAGAAPLIAGSRFRHNLLELQVQDLESVRYEKKLISGEGVTTWFCASLAGTLGEARERAAALEALPTVRKVDGLPALLPEDQADRLQAISRIRRAIEEVLRGRAPVDPEIRVGEIARAVGRVEEALEVAEEGAFEIGAIAAVEEIAGLREAIADLKGRIEETGADGGRLALVQSALQEEIVSMLGVALDHLPSSPITLDDLPASIRDRFLGSGGRHLLMVYPKEDIWGREAKERFLTEVRGIDPEVTGAPVQVFESTNIMKEGYRTAGIVALVVVSLVILIDFRSLRSAGLAMLPLLMGAVWMAGWMRPLGLEFNPANLVVLPLILGIGVVNGVHIMHRYREDPGPLVDILWGSTGKAVLLTSLTTIAGCGALGLLSRHPGLSSLGYVLSLGVAACLLATGLVLPPTMQLLYGTARRASRRRAKRRREAESRLRG